MGGDPDPYAAVAPAYDLFAASARPAQLAALEAWLPFVRPEAGPVLDAGMASALNAAVVLEHVAGAHVWGLEPSRALRGLALSRIAGHPEWFDRVTVRPEDFFSASLPDGIGGALLLGVVGRFDAGERAAVLAELARRLPADGAALLDLRPPGRPRRVEPYEFRAPSVGELAYRGIAEAWPVDLEAMRWRTTYLSLDGERVLTEDTVEQLYRHPSPERVAAEAAQVGLAMRPLGEPGYWLLAPRG